MSTFFLWKSPFWVLPEHLSRMALSFQVLDDPAEDNLHMGTQNTFSSTPPLARALPAVWRALRAADPVQTRLNNSSPSVLPSTPPQASPTLCRTAPEHAKAVRVAWLLVQKVSHLVNSAQELVMKWPHGQSSGIKKSCPHISLSHLFLLLSAVFELMRKGWVENTSFS